LTVTANDHIRELVAAGITGTAEIAAELTRRGIELPTTDAHWTVEDVCRLYLADGWQRRGR
jgi:hypothetical protein